MTMCKTCVYYEFDDVFNSFQCRRCLVPQNNIDWSVPCEYYIEDAKHYKERTEIKKPVKVKKLKECTEVKKPVKFKKLKERKNIREIE